MESIKIYWSKVIVFVGMMEFVGMIEGRKDAMIYYSRIVSLVSGHVLKKIRSVQILQTFYTTVVQAWCNWYIHHQLCVGLKLIVNTYLYTNIKSFKKLNKFNPLPLIKCCFKSQLYTMYLLLWWTLYSMVCHYHSCIIPPLAAAVVCFDFFGR